MTYQAKDNDKFAAVEKQLRQYKERIENEKYIQWKKAAAGGVFHQYLSLFCSLEPSFFCFDW